MKSRCFTLIELLVVIAVVAILLIISFPVLHSVRQRTRALACSTNVRKLTIGLIMYENKNQSFPYGFCRGDTPPPGGYIGDPTLDRIGWWWFHAIEGYIDEDKKRALCCPSKSLADPRLTNNLLYGNYGVNLSICKKSGNIRRNEEEFAGAPLGRLDIPQPSRTLLIVDSGYSIISWWHVTDDPPVPFDDNRKGEDTAYLPGLKTNKDKNLLPDQEQDAIDGRHPNKTVNVGFVDGHVGSLKADDLFVEKTADTYTNKIPIWSHR